MLFLLQINFDTVLSVSSLVKNNFYVTTFIYLAHTLIIILNAKQIKVVKYQEIMA